MGGTLSLSDVLAILAGFFGSIIIIDLRQRVVRLENAVMHLKNGTPQDRED